MRLTNIKSPPIEWGVIIGEFAHNVRSALDHLVWALAVLNSAPCDRTQFPIFRDAKEYANLGIPMLTGLLPTHAAIIEGLQPYQRTQHVETDPLWKLRAISNIDKHRIVHVAQKFANHNTINFDVVEGFEIRDLRMVQQTVVIEGAEIARFRLIQTGSNPKLHMYPNVSGRIAYGPGSGFLQGERLLLTLTVIKEFVDKNVFPKFQSAFI